MKTTLLLFSHLCTLAVGFALGVYFLPILISPSPPSDDLVAGNAPGALYGGTFRRDLEGSDLLHWGEGEIRIYPNRVTHRGALSPGPDYRLYFSREWVETEDEFLRLKPTLVEVGLVNTFENFVVPLPPGFDPSEFNTVVVWCEAFGQFITAARYR